MRLGIFAKTFAGKTPDAVIAQAHAAGYCCVQYNMACSGLSSMPDVIAGATARAVAIAARRDGVAVAAVSGTYNMIHPDIAVRMTGMARLETLAAACSDIGTRLITLCTGTGDPDDQWRGHPDNDMPAAWRDLCIEMTKAADIAERYDIDLGIEPELSNVISSAERAQLLIAEIGSPRLKIVLDPANLFEVETLQRQRDIVSAAVDRLADRIVMGHAKDRTASGGFTAPGLGVIDFRHYIGRLAEAGFAGPLVTHGLEADQAIAVAAFLSGELNACGVELSR